MRKAHKNGNISFIPNCLHFAGKKRFSHIHVNIYVGIASYPDKHGYVSLSLSNTYEKEALDKADIVILELNPNAPRTFGDLEVNVNDVDYFILTDYEIPTIPDGEPNEKDKIIGKYIAEYIHDGDCLQLGIGGIPNAIAASLYDKKNLGIHTEMITSEMAKLAKEIIKGRNFPRYSRRYCAYGWFCFGCGVCGTCTKSRYGDDRYCDKFIRTSKRAIKNHIKELVNTSLFLYRRFWQSQRECFANLQNRLNATGVIPPFCSGSNPFGRVRFPIKIENFLGSPNGNTSSPWLIMCVAHNRRTAVRLSPAVRTLCHVFDSRGIHIIRICWFPTNTNYGSPNGNRTRVFRMRI